MTRISRKIKGLFNKKDYNLLKAIENNPLYSAQPKVSHNRAISIVKKAVTPQPKTAPLLPGTMVTFRYKNPKTKDKLEFFDSNPLVIILGYRKGENGEQLEMGLNIHMFPRKVRFQVIDAIYRMYKNVYDNARKQGISKNFNVDYLKIMNNLKRFNGEFALRSYIPNLRAQTYEIPVDIWESAVFIEPRFRKMEAVDIYRKWSKKFKG